MKTFGVFDLICSFVGHGNIFFISAANVLIQSEKNLENVAGETSNLAEMSSTSNPRRSRINTAKNSSLQVNFLGLQGIDTSRSADIYVPFLLQAACNQKDCRIRHRMEGL